MIILGLFSTTMLMITILMYTLCIAAKESDIKMTELFNTYEYNKLK